MIEANVARRMRVILSLDDPRAPSMPSATRVAVPEMRSNSAKDPAMTMGAGSIYLDDVIALSGALSRS